jgi:KOW motif
MFNRLRTLFDGRPRVGDLVTVRIGPYAGKSGTVTAVEGDAATVYIDECCQPKLPHRAIRAIRAGRRTPDAAPNPAGTDEEYEMARARINQLPPPGI